MNNFLLKDFHCFENLIQSTCDNFVNKIKRISDNESDVAVGNLEDEIYLWTSYCNSFCNFTFKNLIPSFLVTLNLMLGSSTSEQCDRSFDELVWKAVKTFQKIMKLSAQLSSIPPKIASKVLHLKSWQELENAQLESLEICEWHLKRLHYCLLNILEGIVKLKIMFHGSFGELYKHIRGFIWKM